MSVAVCTEINARLRTLGYTVHEAPGWQTRGNVKGWTTAFVGGLIHHTATGFLTALPGTGIYDLLFVKGRTGENPLAPPLCNYAGNADGSFTCGAAGPANHAGASGGRSMGPLPVTTSFNRRVLGLEIVYPGTMPMNSAQYRSATAWGAVVAAVVGGGDPQRIRAHAETSVTGKWDPGCAPNQTIDMVRFRADVANYQEERVQNLIIAHRTGETQHWVGDGITRRKVTNLTGLQHWIRERGGNPDVAVIDDLDAVLGLEDKEIVLPPAQVEIDYARFVSDVVDQLATRLGTLRFHGVVSEGGTT